MTTHLSAWPPPASTTEASRTEVQALLPEPSGPIPPVTARRMRRALAVYAAVWVLGVLPALLDAGAPLTAVGLGLTLPGGGFVYSGSVIASVAAPVVFLLAVVAWWFAGMTVLPPLVWLGAAALSALTSVDGQVSDGARFVVPSLVPALLLISYLVHRVRYAGHLRTREKINARLADVRFTVSGPPPVNTPLPVAESSPADLAHLRYALDLALQPLDSFTGFTVLDQYREAALRYQIYALSYGLAMAQFTRTPAFSGYLAEAQQHAVEKVLQRRIWGYWAAENAWGNLSANRDPVANRENIMLTGWHGVGIGMYETLNDDRYSRPGGLTYRWSDTEAYPYDFPQLAQSIRRNMLDWDFTLFPCEPNWIYSICNTFGINTLLMHDRTHHSRFMEELAEPLRRSYESEFLRPDGRIVGIRAAHLGLSWNFWSGAAVQLNTSYWLNPGMPDIAARTWWLLRENHLVPDADGRLTLPPSASDRLDPGNYKLGRDTFGQVALTMAAREIGDEDSARAAQALLDEREPIEEANGARRYRDASPLANLYAVLGRFGRRNGLRDMVTFGAPQVWREGPRLAEVAYPDVLVASAHTDGRALDLVLRPGAGPTRAALGLDRLVPHAEYRVDGALGDTVTADGQGRAIVEVELGDRRPVRLYPSGS
ncbi:hypothetical protein [Pseudonocardia spinosispora]|uniref:linalool dehydratase/isomerase domain-containing protein n=1 Tax=Pseudonocardia spinosispora TaxID=103441 RepID=UPI0003F8C8DF|nr:hypothetical protein [Pseudonocardia spinosispora]